MYKLLFFKLLGVKLKKKNSIILNHTFGKSFIFGEKDAKRKLLVFRYFFSILKKGRITTRKINRDYVIVDVNKHAKSIRVSYLNYFNDPHEYDFLCLNDLVGFISSRSKFVFFISYLPLVCIAFLVSLFYKDKTSFALLAQHALIKKNLKFFLDKNKVYNLYYFSIYDLASNYLTDVFIKLGHRVIKVPSQVPLSLWNTNILSSKLIVSNAYQFEEIEYYKDSVIYEQIEFWGPEKCYEYIDYYRGLDRSKGSRKIGFYSTASWIRQLEGHMDQGVDMVKGEKIVLETLKKIVGNHSALELLVFLHPKEKNKDLEEVKNYYDKILGEDNYSIFNPTVASHYCFAETELAVAFNTTLMYERLYMGFKSILFPMNKKFPIPNTSIESICAKDSEQLYGMILESMNMNVPDFFERNRISHYIGKVVVQ